MELNDWGPDGLDARADLQDATREFGAQFPQCPGPAMVQAARAGVLPAQVRDRLNAHVAQCAACASLASDLFTLDEAPLPAGGQQRIWARIQTGIAAEENRAQSPAPGTARLPDPPWWKFLFRPMPTALAAAALAVTIGVRWQQPKPPAAVVSQVRQPDAVTPKPAGVLRLDKPPVMLPAAVVLVWRGALDAADAPGQGRRDAPRDARRDALRDALVPYEADRYSEAAVGLESLAKKFPALAEAHFYLGVCRLFMERNADAVVSLKRARSLAPPALADDAAWYLALAYHRSGLDSDARPLLEQLCSGTPRNSGENSEKDSAKACSGLKELSVVQ